MVAYSFKKIFVPDIQAGRKMQTVRAFRKRHARPGEMIQLYCGMRTKHCFKIIPDVLCVSVEPISIDVSPIKIKSIALNSQKLCFNGMNQFAINDGFSDIGAMHQFWLKEHGEGLFYGDLIKWETAS